MSGFNTFFAALTGKYSSAEKIYGDMAVPFYYYAKSYCETLGFLTVAAVSVMILTIILLIISVIKKTYRLNLIVCISFVAETVLLIVCFSVALSMNGSRILHGYCNDNPACSIRSYAIIPAVIALIGAIVSAIPAVRYYRAKRRIYQ